MEELHIDTEAKNNEGQTAREKIESEEDYPEVAEYLAGRVGGQISRPPPLPPNVKVNIGNEVVEEGGQEPDPEFRRRIEGLAARENFHTEEGQRELRDLIQVIALARVQLLAWLLAEPAGL